MKLDISHIKFSHGDLRKGIHLPRFLTPELAEDIGIHVGDGTMYMCGPTKSSYVMRYYGHRIEDKPYLSTFVPRLKNKLYGVGSVRFETKRLNEAQITICSMAISTFYHRVFGVEFGNKTKTVDIPDLVKNATRGVKAAFMRGLADTDFSISFKKKSKSGCHAYPVISGYLASRNLVRSSKQILEDLGMKPVVMYNLEGKRYGKISIMHRIELNGRKNLKVWLKSIGFHNERHLTKLHVWKTFGYCPPNTNRLQRERMLQQHRF